MTTFSDLGLAAPILKALENEGYQCPTPIQAQAIPHVLSGRDLMGIAQTGTGKTAAFALPILDRLVRQTRRAPRGGCRVLVLSPTRELATQIADSFRTYGRHLGLSVAVIVGGVSHRPQADALRRGIDILVATPGRLIDHVDERTCQLATTEIFVLDEADQMLDLGFVKPIRRIASGLSQRRQSLFFSATMPREIAELAREFLREPAHVAVTPQATTVERIDQRVIHIDAKRKRALLAELLADGTMTRTLVFTRTKRGADRVAKSLEAAGIKAAAIHGNKSQNQREAALDAFRKARVRVLVATDIAARGIDVDGVSHVVNFELPEVPEAYVHRIGRTARAGADGIAISFCAPDERDLLRDIERVTRQRIAAENRIGDVTLEVLTGEPAGLQAPREGRGAPRQGRGRSDGRKPHGTGQAQRAGDRSEKSPHDGAQRTRGSGHRHTDGRGGARGEQQQRNHHAESRPPQAGRHATDNGGRGQRPQRASGDQRAAPDAGFRNRPGRPRRPAQARGEARHHGGANR